LANSPNREFLYEDIYTYDKDNRLKEIKRYFDNGNPFAVYKFHQDLNIDKGLAEILVNI